MYLYFAKGMTLYLKLTFSYQNIISLHNMTLCCIPTFFNPSKNDTEAFETILYNFHFFTNLAIFIISTICVKHILHSTL